MIFRDFSMVFHGFSRAFPSRQECHWCVTLSLVLTAASAGLLRGALGVAGAASCEILIMNVINS